MNRYDLVPREQWAYLGPAFRGIDNDLTALANGSSTSLSAVAKSGAYADLTGRPTLAAVATSGAYADLTGRPVDTGVKPRTTLTASSPAVDVLPHLPPRGYADNGVIRTISRFLIDSSTSWPLQVTWTDPTLLGLIVQNPTDSGTNVNIGPQAMNSPNHTGSEPDVIQPGQEWVDTHGARPVRARCSTSGATAVLTVIAVRSA